MADETASAGASPQTGGIEREIHIDASPETVFAFFTDPALYVRWKGKLATLDPRPGGLYRVNIDGTRVARGEFVEVSPHRRIVFTWGWEDPGNPVQPGESTVEVELRPDGEGTLLRLVHRDLPEEATAGHAEGWDHFLPQLAVAVK
jgi:uncharacterized protein YndB with AHSA1/START domain